MQSQPTLPGRSVLPAPPTTLQEAAPRHAAGKRSLIKRCGVAVAVAFSMFAMTVSLGAAATGQTPVVQMADNAVQADRVSLDEAKAAVENTTENDNLSALVELVELVVLPLPSDPKSTPNDQQSASEAQATSAIRQVSHQRTLHCDEAVFPTGHWTADSNALAPNSLLTGSGLIADSTIQTQHSEPIQPGTALPAAPYPGQPTADPYSTYPAQQLAGPGLLQPGHSQTGATSAHNAGCACGNAGCACGNAGCSGGGGGYVGSNCYAPSGLLGEKAPCSVCNDQAQYCPACSMPHWLDCASLLTRYEYGIGVNAFTGPINYPPISGSMLNTRGTGSFGFYQSMNHATPLDFVGLPIGWQSGMRLVESNLSGGGSTTDSRFQYYWTGGFFHRATCGLQFATLFDYQHQDWYFRGDLWQFRSEFSWMNMSGNDWGIQWMVPMGTEATVATILDASGWQIRETIRYNATSQVRFFYRINFADPQSPTPSTLNLFLGGADGDFVFGGDFNQSLSPTLGLYTGATYLSPDRIDSASSGFRESWNISFGLQWRPGIFMNLERGPMARPMLDIADNGTMMIDWKR